jgi:hypothetical protein
MNHNPFSSVPGCGPATIKSLENAGIKTWADLKPPFEKPSGVTAPVWDAILKLRPTKITAAPAPVAAAVAGIEIPEHSWNGLFTLLEIDGRLWPSMISSMWIDRETAFFEVRTRFRKKVAVKLVTPAYLVAVDVITRIRALNRHIEDSDSDDPDPPAMQPLGKLVFKTDKLTEDTRKRVHLSVGDADMLQRMSSM